MSEPQQNRPRATQTSATPRQPSANHAAHEELYRLASDVLWGEPSEEDVQRLEQLVTTSGDARQSYVEFICDSCNLQAYAARNAPEALLSPASAVQASRAAVPAAGRSSPVLGFLHNLLRARGRWPAMVPGVVAVLGAVVVAAIVFLGRGNVEHPGAQEAVASRAMAGSEADARNRGGEVAQSSNVADVPKRNVGDADVAATTAPALSAPASPAARLARAVDCRWADAADAPQAGDPLAVGRRLELLSGAAEIVFAGGARGVLKGPASLEISSSASAALAHGTFSVDNAAPTDFDLLTPGMKYLLASAEFAVDIGSAGIQEVHVFRGVIKGEKSMEGFAGRGGEIASAGRPRPGRGGRPTRPPHDVGIAQPIELSANEACRIGAADKPVERFSADQSRFLHASQFAIAAAPEPADYLRWKEASAKLAKDRDLIAYYDFQCDRSTPTILYNRAASGEKLDGHIENALWVQGRWPIKGALQFRGKSNCVRVNIPGKFDVLTAAAWIRLRVLRAPLTSIIGSDGWHQRVGQCHWQIVFNGLAELAPCFSTTPSPVKLAEITACHKATLQSADRTAWCHLAAVYNCPANTVAYYRNGRLVGVAHPATHLVPVEFGPSEIGNWDPEPRDKGPSRFFHGSIDELVLMSRALSEQEIKAMYYNGKPDDVK